MNLRKQVTIDDVTYRAKHRKWVALTPSSCRNCDIYKANAPYRSMAQMPRCQDGTPKMEKLQEFCAKALDEDIEVWFERVNK